MKDGFIRVGCANFEVSLGQVQHNAQKVISYVKEANENISKFLFFQSFV
mgnify:CR=1 FL=1